MGMLSHVHGETTLKFQFMLVADEILSFQRTPKHVTALSVNHSHCQGSFTSLASRDQKSTERMNLFHSYEIEIWWPGDIFMPETRDFLVQNRENCSPTF